MLPPYPMPWAENRLPAGALPLPRPPDPAEHYTQKSTTSTQVLGALTSVLLCMCSPRPPLSLRPRSEPLSTGVTSTPFSSGRAGRAQRHMHKEKKKREREKRNHISNSIM